MDPNKSCAGLPRSKRGEERPSGRSGVAEVAPVVQLMITRACQDSYFGSERSRKCCFNLLSRDEALLSSQRSQPYGRPWPGTLVN